VNAHIHVKFVGKDSLSVATSAHTGSSMTKTSHIAVYSMGVASDSPNLEISRFVLFLSTATSLNPAAATAAMFQTSQPPESWHIFFTTIPPLYSRNHARIHYSCSSSHLVYSEADIVNSHTKTNSTSPPSAISRPDSPPLKMETSSMPPTRSSGSTSHTYTGTATKASKAAGKTGR
jgi:hypothetical protein